MFRAVELEYSGPKSISRLAEKLGKRKMNEGAASLFAELYQQDHGVVEARISGIEFWLWRGEFHHAAQELADLKNKLVNYPSSPNFDIFCIPIPMKRKTHKTYWHYTRSDMWTFLSIDFDMDNKFSRCL